MTLVTRFANRANTCCGNGLQSGWQRLQAVVQVVPVGCPVLEPDGGSAIADWTRRVLEVLGSIRAFLANDLFIFFRCVYVFRSRSGRTNSKDVGPARFCFVWQVAI